MVTRPKVEARARKKTLSTRSWKTCIANSHVLIPNLSSVILTHVYIADVTTNLWLDPMFSDEAVIIWMGSVTRLWKIEGCFSIFALLWPIYHEHLVTFREPSSRQPSSRHEPPWVPDHFAQLDFVLAPNRWGNAIQDVTSRSNIFTDSDHYIVTADCRVKLVARSKGDRTPRNRPPTPHEKLSFNRFHWRVHVGNLGTSRCLHDANNSSSRQKLFYRAPQLFYRAPQQTKTCSHLRAHLAKNTKEKRCPCSGKLGTSGATESWNKERCKTRQTEFVACDITAMPIRTWKMGRAQNSSLKENHSVHQTARQAWQ